MKRILSSVLVIAMMMQMIVTCSFAVASSDGDCGVMMTIEEFNERYVGKDAPCERVTTMSTSNQNSPTVRYSNISFDASTREISFNAEIAVADETTNIVVNGIMYSSDKKDLGINSLVGDVKDITGKVDVLRFEIYNDNDYSRLYAINNNEPTTPVLLFYFLRNDELFLFETEIPTEMKNISVADDCRVGPTEGHLDGFWFQNIVTPTLSYNVEYIDNDSVASSRGVERTYAIAGLNAIWEAGGTEYRYFADLQIYYRVSDVSSTASNWKVQLKITDAYAIVDGVRKEWAGLYLNNINIGFAAGAYTMLESWTPSFTMHTTYDGPVISAIVGFLGVIPGMSFPKASAAYLLSLLTDSALDSFTIQNNQTTWFDPTGNDVAARACRYSIPGNYNMILENDRLLYTLGVTSSPFGDSDATAGYDYARIEISFDYYTSNGTHNTCPVEAIDALYYCDPDI